jgi:hypothetical protein
MKCQDFNFEVQYLPGKENVMADSLSRYPTSSPDQEDIQAANDTARHVRAILTAMKKDAELSLQEQRVLDAGNLDIEYCHLRDQIRQGFPESKTTLDPLINQYWQIRHDLHVGDDDIILYGTRMIIPRSLRSQVLDDLHSGHRGIVGAKARASNMVYWPNCNNDIEQKCRACTRCPEERPSLPAEPQIHFPPPVYTIDA